MLHFSRWKTVFIWLLVLASVFIASPNLFTDKQLEGMPAWYKDNKVTLGLDLQGGSHIMLKIEHSEIIKERLETIIGDVCSQLRDANIRYSELTGNGQQIQVRISDPTQLEAAKNALRDLTQPVSAGTLVGVSITEVMMSDGGDNLLRFNLTDEGVDYRLSSAVSQSIEVVRRRVDEVGTTAPLIQRQGSDRIIVQVPGLQDPQRLKSLLKQMAKLSFRMIDTTMPVQEAMSGHPPVTSEVLYSQDDPLVPYLVERRTLVSGDNLVDAQTSFNPQTNEPVVTFRFDSRGAQRFAQATQQNVGKPLAIVLDNQVISAPVIREPIIGGSGQISGNFSIQNANDLAVLLRTGALPATLTVVEERTVGPSLGNDSITAGLIASAIGAVGVLIFMFVFYGFFGLLANIALVVNVIMLLAVLSVIESTLTLPGIAGIVLIIGMAVDSNVLIYERIREEVKSNKPLIQSLENGFTSAFATIIDANLTTLIVAGVLFYMGTGPVKGFAVTLAIGIVTTVFTAYTLTAWMFGYWVRRSRPKHLPKGVRTAMFDGRGIPFMRYRRMVFMIIGIIMFACFGGFVAKGLNLGIDFQGGSVVEVRAKQGDADIADIRERLNQLNLGEVQAQNFGTPQDVLIRIQAQDSSENTEQSVITMVRGEFEDKYDFRRIEIVGPVMSSDLTFTSTAGVLLAMAAIMVYIWVRFEWQFALGAVISMGYDVVFTIGLLVFFGIEFNLTSIAAILTVIGYSLNDTVVIYDRIRENLRRYKKMPLSMIIDVSLNQTLSRTILTSLTVLLALLALYLFGGEVIRSFTFAMLFGVGIGVFSSLYIAAPMLIAFKLRSDSKDEEDEKDEKSGIAIGGKPAV